MDESAIWEKIARQQENRMRQPVQIDIAMFFGGGEGEGG